MNANLILTDPQGMNEAIALVNASFSVKSSDCANDLYVGLDHAGAILRAMIHILEDDPQSRPDIVTLAYVALEKIEAMDSTKERAGVANKLDTLANELVDFAYAQQQAQRRHAEAAQALGVAAKADADLGEELAAALALRRLAKEDSQFEPHRKAFMALAAGRVGEVVKTPAHPLADDQAALCGEMAEALL